MSAQKDIKYPCESCEFKASTKSHLRRHQQSVHEDKHQCELREYMASEKGSLAIALKV
jgi:uncharacterized Zn-finger protein